MHTLTPKKANDRFAPIVVRSALTPAGHPSKFCRTGARQTDKRLARQNTRRNQVKVHLKDW